MLICITLNVWGSKSPPPTPKYQDSAPRAIFWGRVEGCDLLRHNVITTTKSWLTRFSRCLYLLLYLLENTYLCPLDAYVCFRIRKQQWVDSVCSIMLHLGPRLWLRQHLLSWALSSTPLKSFFKCDTKEDGCAAILHANRYKCSTLTLSSGWRCSTHGLTNQVSLCNRTKSMTS